MEKHLEDALNGEACVLFTQKACHVFADELIGQPPAEGWMFYRLGSEKIPVLLGQGYKAALHVCVGKNDCFVDFRGKHTMEELLSDWRRQLPPQLSRHVEGIYPCTKDDLFEKPQFDIQPRAGGRSYSDFLPGIDRAFEEQSNRIGKNKWGLVIDPEFLERARKNARAAINRDPAKYDLESLC